MTLSPSAIVERTRRNLKGYTGRSAKQLLLSKLPGARQFAFAEPAYLSMEEAQVLLQTRDLSDPEQGEHVMQQIVSEAMSALQSYWGTPAQVVRPKLIVGVDENYGRLCFNPSAIIRDRLYSYRLSSNLMLRTHLSSAIPNLLQELKKEHGQESGFDSLYFLPGLAYRRETADRFHAPTFHQLDIWRFREGQPFTAEDENDLISVTMNRLFPGMQWRLTPTKHPYTRRGRQIDILFQGEWLEIAECGIVGNNLLGGEGLDTKRWAGMCFGLGLDRAVMVSKGLPDIRLLRVEDEAVQSQFLNLQEWEPVSTSQPVVRDLQLQLNNIEDDDTFGDHIHHALGADSRHLREARILHRHTGKQGVILTAQIVFQGLQQDLSDLEVDQLCTKLVRGLNAQLIS